jgi:hypothetical protein
MRHRWIYGLVGAVPFWIWTCLEFRARRAEPVKWVLPDNGGLASTALPTAVILTAAGVFMWLFDFNNRPNL